MDERSPDELPLRAEVDGDRVRLSAPAVGLWTRAVPRGRVLSPGQEAGVLLVLGRAHPLVVPEGVAGVVTSERPERVHEPVGWGQVLYELSTAESPAVAGAPAAAERAGPSGALVVPAPQAGRFWHRAAPGDPPFAAPGQELAPGSALGLIEVMKTFTQVAYRAAGGLPERARVVRHLVEDGAEVAEGDALIEVEAG